MGRSILECHRTISQFHPEIQVLQYCLMPDHLHSIWYVRRPMNHGIMTAVRGFWQATKAIGREFSSVAPNDIRDNQRKEITGNQRNIDGKTERQFPIFTKMPFVRPMSRRGQLQTMIHYVQMNPQRLATKRLKPGYFRVQEGIEIAGRKYAGVGNVKLLLAEQIKQVHVRSIWVEDSERHGRGDWRDEHRE